MAALADAALHAALERDVYVVGVHRLLAHLGDDVPVHDRRTADRAVGPLRVHVDLVEELRNEADLAVPGVVGSVNRQDQVEIVPVPPHVELSPEQDLGRGPRTV